MIAINCAKVESKITLDMREISELGFLIYNASRDYVNLLVHGDIQEYLKNVTEYRPFKN